MTIHYKHSWMVGQMPIFFRFLSITFLSFELQKILRQFWKWQSIPENLYFIGHDNFVKYIEVMASYRHYWWSTYQFQSYSKLHVMDSGLPPSSWKCNFIFLTSPLIFPAYIYTCIVSQYSQKNTSTKVGTAERRLSFHF